MNELTTLKSQQDLLLALKGSVYPDASMESINLVLSYCKSLNLDPLLKPVHITRIKDKDVLMPSINLYRTMAERSGSYCGLSEPVFGREIVETINGTKVTYPETCSVTVHKMVDGKICNFTATERWVENVGYTKDGAVTSFWAKRPYGQLAKVCEAQALRKAFPSHVTAQVSMEEMHTEIHDIEGERLSDAQIAVKNAANKLKHQMLSKPPAPLLDQINRLIMEQNITQEEIKRWMDKAQVTELGQLSVHQMTSIIDKYKGE